MGPHSKHSDRMDIYIEESRKTILIKQKWKYAWLNALGTSPWTYAEKKAFHNKTDSLIWSTWGQHFFLRVEGTSDFAKRNKGQRWRVNFDIEWVLHTEHWRVNVTKISSNFARSNINWNRKEVNLDTKDVNQVTRRGKNQ